MYSTNKILYTGPPQTNSPVTFQKIWRKISSQTSNSEILKSNGENGKNEV